jgi:hypothetical protein
MYPAAAPDPTPGPIDESALALECGVTAVSLRAIRRALYRLIAANHGILGERSAAAVILGAEEMAAALEKLAALLRPGRPD